MFETIPETPSKRPVFSVAPMMDWTDRYCRLFHRQLTRHAVLYTEMVTADAVIHGDRERLLGFDADEHPVVFQLGGSEPEKMAEAARIVEDFGYDAANINCGCPSDRVQSGRFGACLMREPETVAALVAAMRAAVSIPVTVKCRIGVDDQEDYADLKRFVDIVSAAGCSEFTVHARKAWLKGLSPKENRDIPPLNHPLVERLKADRPDLTLVANGGLSDMAAIRDRIEKLDGAMVGRAAYQDPWLLASVDPRIFGDAAPAARRADAIAAMLPLIDRERGRGVPLHSITRHMLGLANGLPGARAYRRVLSEEARDPSAGPEVVEKAFGFVREDLPAGQPFVGQPDASRAA
ncbi:MAG: tRNA dihydrouridine(20/20a) synthase DusA [Alphaproteobacteria bacterium]|nr:tRNA dihydrouridine(20/20a) synthase DusA [Alphaproteobacteria bacterium]